MAKEKEKEEALNPQQEKLKALQAAMSKIEKDYGKGSIMRMGDEHVENVDVIPTGSIGLNAALGVGGYPKGRIIEIYGPESSVDHTGHPRYRRVSEGRWYSSIHRCRARFRPFLCSKPGCRR